MKNLVLTGTMFLSLSLLVACGGGDKSTGVSVEAPVNTPQTPNVDAAKGDLIIDNGRGTSNNQDTERAKD